MTQRPHASRDAWWTGLAFIILGVAAALRLYDLDLKPLHHDEGVNGLILMALAQPPHVYRYAADNFHGPTLFYAGWLSVELLGLTTVAIRCVTAVSGLAVILLVLSMRRAMGRVGTLAAAALLALSPGAVYFSRYFIHEMLLVCFTLGLVACGWRAIETRRAGALLGASAFAALMWSTKETAIITIVVLGLACICVTVWSAVRGGRWSWPDRAVAASVFAELRDRTMRRAWMWGAAIALFVLVSASFYTSFFTYPEGAGEAWRSLAIWQDTGRRTHVHPWDTYLSWLWQAERPLLLAGGCGVLVALCRANDRFALFAAFWAAGTLAAYSLIPYKTPWLTLNVILPLAISAGCLAQRLAASRRPWRWGLAVAAPMALAVLGVQAVLLNFHRYDQEGEPYAYVHTRRDIRDLLEAIQRIRERAGMPVSIAVMAREHFPLPWYLRADPVGYYGRVQKTSDPIVIVSARQEQDLRALLGDTYTRVGRYPLRPGVRLVLFVRQDLAAAPAGRSRDGTN